MNSNKQAKIAIEAMEDKKAEDIKIIEISNISTIADYFIIATGTSSTQVHAIANNVEEQLGKKGILPKQIEGYQSANWVLMDYGDLIIHVFDKENRLFYNLERIWKDGNEITKDSLTD